MSRIRKYTIGNARTCKRDGSQPTGLQGKALELTLDNTWAPYGQGTLTCVAPGAVNLGGIEPRNGLRTRFTLTQDNVDGTVFTRNFDLSLQDRPRQASLDEVALGIQTDEGLWQQWADATANPQDQFSAASAGAWAAGRLGYVQNQNYFTLNAAPDVEFLANEANWDSGVTAWDYASQLAEVAGAWLYCDEQAIFRYAPVGYTPDTSPTMTLDDASAVVDVTDTISRDSRAWANYVLVEYTKDDPHKFAVASSGTATRKAVVVQRNRKKPTNGNAAQTMLASFLRRGRTLQVEAIADIRLRPNWTVTTIWQGQSFTGTAQSVTFNFPAGRMSVLVNVTE